MDSIRHGGYTVTDMVLRVRAWIIILLCVASMAGVSFWSYLKTRQAARVGHWRWGERTAALAAAELPKYQRWLATLPRQLDAPEAARQAPYRVAAFYLADTENHRSGRWISPRIAGEAQRKLETIDARLVVLQLRSLETGRAQIGPVLALNDALYVTAVRPLDSRRALTAVIEAPELRRLLEEESRLWQKTAWVFDDQLNLLYGRGGAPPEVSLLREALVEAEKGDTRVALSQPVGQGWKFADSASYDPTLRWLMVVSEPLPNLWFPLVLFAVCLAALMVITRFPWRAVEDLRRARTASDLRVFASRVDEFVRGREPSLPDPPYPYGRELGGIVQSLRWLMPLWKKAEQFPKDLGLEKKLLSLLVESLPEGILFFNAEGALQLSNEAGRVFFALHQEAGREFKMVSGIQVPRGFLEPFVESVFTGEQKTNGKEVEVKWADGKHLYRIWVEAVEAEQDHKDGYMVVVRDITFRRQWEYVQEQVLSGITHDLRGPLSAVMGYLDLLKKVLSKGELTPKALEYVGLGKEAAVRLNQMVSDILDVVRFEQGKIELAPAGIPVLQIFDRLRNIFAVTAEQKSVSLILKPETPPTASVWGDPKLLERVLDNLVGNAIKFTPQGGTITVRAWAENGRKLFQVSDTGRGIPKEAQSRIFDKFQQVRPGDRSAGYGLGLAVAKFIVEAHKGEIRVESEVGQGSTFTLWIPDQPSA